MSKFVYTFNNEGAKHRRANLEFVVSASSSTRADFIVGRALQNLEIRRRDGFLPTGRPLTRFVRDNDGSGLVDTESRTVRLSFSSEEPVDMWYGREILDHSRSSVRLDGVRQRNMPLLYNHNMDDLLGVVESVDIQHRRGYAMVRFAKDARGEWAMQAVQDGILTNTSFMYKVYKYEVPDGESGSPTFRAVDWQPYEISLVTVPADPTVGVGRTFHFGAKQ
jgi:HK97 family phage prohead protease